MGNSKSQPNNERLLENAGEASESKGNAVQQQRTASTVWTCLNLTKCFVGAASFELPWAFAESGAVGGVVGVLVLAAFSMFSLQRLAMCSTLILEQRVKKGEDEDKAAPTFPDVGLEAMGMPGKVMAWFGVVAMSLGVCGSYMVFITSTLAKLTGFGTQTTWLLIMLPIISLLSWIRRVSTLAFTSTAGVIALVVAVAVCTVDAALHGHNVTIDWDGSGANDTMPLLRLSTYPLFLGNAGYLYLISTAILPVSQSMRKPEEFGKAFLPSIAFVTVVNVAFGLYVAARYGGHVCSPGDNRTPAELDCVLDNVLGNMAPGILTTLVKWALVVDLIFTTIVFLFPINEAIEQALLAPWAKKLPVPAPGVLNFWASPRTWVVNSLRVVVAIAIAGVALGVPFFSLLTGLTGGFGNNILGFILPPAFYARLRGADYFKEKTKCPGARAMEIVGLAITFAFGLVFLVLTLYFFTKQIIST